MIPATKEVTMSQGSWLSRRRFLKQTGVTLGTAAVSSSLLGRQTQTLRLGGPVFLKSEDPAELAQAHRDLGYRAAFAPKMKLSETERIQATVREFAARDVVIAEVGAWVNMLDSDPKKRSQNLAFVTERLALAEELGALCCVDIAGSFNPDVWSGPHPENFSREFLDRTVENVRKVVDAVKPRRTTFAIEMMGWALPSTPDEYLELLEAVDRSAFAVHVDVCNMINSPSLMYNNTTLIQECFVKLGPKIVSCHAKDVAWVPSSQVHFKEVIPGHGVIDYATYLRELSRLPIDVPLMMEHLRSAAQYDDGRSYIQGVAHELGLSFG